MREQSRNVRRADFRRTYLAQVPLSFTVGCVTAVTGIILFFCPSVADVSALNQSLPRWAERLWAALYATGGVSLVWGILRLKPSIEAAGCFLTGGTVGVNIYAIAAVRGTGALASAVIVGVSLGFVVRGFVLLGRYTE